MDTLNFKLMRSIFCFALVVTLISFASCNADQESSTQSVPSNYTTFVLSGLSSDFQMSVPKSMPGVDVANIEYNSNFGHLDVSFGEGFNLFISEEEIAIRTLMDELENDMLFGYEFIEMNDSVLVFQSKLPDGSPYSYHFKKIRRIGGKSLLIQTVSMSKFNLQQLNRMAAAVNTISLSDQ